MTGLDKMKSQILDEAKAAAEGKIAEAKAQAEETIRSAKEDAAKQTESILHKSKNDVSNYQERLESSIDLQKRTKILAAKQEVIAESAGKGTGKGRSDGSRRIFLHAAENGRKVCAGTGWRDLPVRGGPCKTAGRI